VLDVIGVAAGETFATAGKSLIFTLGLTLVGEAIVLSMRSGATWQRPALARAPERVPVYRHEHHHHDHDHHGRRED
jgi:hypothetical protein